MNRRLVRLASSWSFPLSRPSRWLAAILFAGAIAPWAGSAPAADTNGTWIVDGNGLWSDLDTANWSGGLVADGTGYTADFGAIDIAADRVVSLASARTIGNLIFGDTATSSAAGWTLNNNATPANVLTLAGTTPTITVNALAPYDIYAPKSATVGGTIAGSSGLTKTGAGRLKLTGANTYTGGTVVNGGTLAIINDNNLGAVPGSFDAANITLNNGATLDATAAADAYNAGNTVTLGANRGITLGAGIQTIVKNHRGIELRIYGVIGGVGGVDFKEPTTGDDGGGSRTHLYAANTYNGDTTITHAGIKDPGLFLHHSLALQNSTLNYVVTGSDTTLLWFDSAAGSYTLGGLKGGKNLNLSPQGNSAKNLKIGNNNQDTSYTGNISSSNDAAAGITKIGAGTLTLSGANTYTGATTISNGTLEFAKRRALYNGATASWTPTKINVSSGATLAVGVGANASGYFDTSDLDTLLGVACLGASTSTTGLKNGSVLGLDTTNAAGGFTYGTSIVDLYNGNGLSLAKLGANTLTLTGANAYTGNTTVKQGALVTGAISGPGSTELYANTQLTANSINQDTLIIGAGATVTIREFPVAVGGAAGATAVPEPGTWMLIGGGLLCWLAFRRSRRERYARNEHPYADPLQPAAAEGDLASQTREVGPIESPSAHGGLLYLLAASCCMPGRTCE